MPAPRGSVGVLRWTVKARLQTDQCVLTTCLTFRKQSVIWPICLTSHDSVTRRRIGKPEVHWTMPFLVWSLSSEFCTVLMSHWRWSQINHYLYADWAGKPLTRSKVHLHLLLDVSKRGCVYCVNHRLFLICFMHVYGDSLQHVTRHIV